MNVPVVPPEGRGGFGNALMPMPDRAPTSDSLSSMDILQLVSRLRRRLVLMVSVGAVVLAAVIVITLQMTPLYKATSSVLLDVRKQTVVDMKAVVADAPPDASMVETEVQVLKSRRLAENVVNKLKLDDNPEFNKALRKGGVGSAVKRALAGFNKAAAPVDAQQRMAQLKQRETHEAVVDTLMDRTNVERVGLTYVIEISATSEKPELAAQIANAYADAYMTSQLDGKFDATRRANDWLSDRLAGLRTQVQQSEAAVEQYKTANNLLSASGTTLTEQEISTYNQQLASARAEVAEREARVSTARKQLAKGSVGDDVGEALGSQVIQNLRAQRAAVSGRVADLAGRYGPRHPEMLKAQRELDDIDQQIRSEIVRIISNLEAQAEVARTRANAINGSLAGARGTLSTNNNASVKLRELELNAESVRGVYESFLNRFKETSQQPGLDVSEARVMSLAKVPTDQNSPKIILNIAIGIILAGMFGLAAAIIAEMTDTGLGTGEEVEPRTGVPYIGAVPLAASVIPGGGSPTDLVVEKPLSSLTEAFRVLRNSLRYSQLDAPAKIIAITSALPGEGKSTTSVSLARVAAMSGDRVIVIDCDLRRGNISRLLKVAPDFGLLDVLNGSVPLEQALFRDELTSMMVLPLSKGGFSPKDVFGSRAMSDLLARLTHDFDLVILDTAPLLAVADTRSLLTLADAVVFIARWRKTPQKAITAALRIASTSHAKLTGLLLTMVDMRQQTKYGYGDAGYYYAQYEKYYSKS